MGADKNRKFSSGIRVALWTGAALLGALLTAEDVQAQMPGVLRSQTQAITGAISRQISQAMRPRLQIRNSAGAINGLQISPGGETIAIASADGGLRVWDLTDGRQLRRLQAGQGSAFAVGAVPVAPRGGTRSANTTGERVVATGGSDGSITLWDVISGGQMRQFRGHQGAVQALRIARDGRVMASGGADGTVRLWDVAGGRQQAQLTGHAGAVTALAFSPSGKLVASGGADQTVRLWSAADGRAVASFSGAGGAVSALAFLGEDKVVSGAADGSVKVWGSGGSSAVDSWRADGPVTGLSAAGTSSVAAASGGGSATVWSASGSRQGQVSDSGNRITFIAFAADGKRVITAGSSGLARIWDASNGRPVAQIILTGTGWAVVDPSGRFDGSERGLGDVSWAADQGVFEISNFSETYYEPGLLAKALRAPEAIITTQAPPVEQGVGVPPTVTLASSAGTQAAAPGPVTITVTAQDQGGSVDEVKLYQNGKALDPERITGDSVTNQGGRPARQVAFRADLSPGNNEFRAVATTVQKIESLPATLSVRVAAPERKPVLHVVVVGINQYANPAMTLNYAVADARGFIDWAKRSVSSSFGPPQVYELMDRAATRDNIRGLFRKLRNAQPEDVVVIYLAGHGENAKGVWNFLPTEFGRTMSLDAVSSEGLSAKMIEDDILKIGAQRVFMVIDACKSGNLSRAFAADADRRNLQSVSRSAGIHVLAATDKDQLAVELSELGHGAMTWTVLDGLAGKADTQPADGVVRAKELLNYSVETVPVVAFKYTQMEQFPTIFSRGADFEVSRRR